MKTSEIVSKVKTVPSYVKTHWNTPGEGEYLSLKEMAAYVASQSGSYIYCTASNIEHFPQHFSAEPSWKYPQWISI